MKILVEFESLEEFFQYMKPQAGDPVPEPSEDAEPAITVVVPEEKPEPAKEEPEVEAPPEKEEASAKSYTLSDAQKAVREVVKLKGKDAAKKVLSGFKHKDHDNEPATGASALQPEDYAEAIKRLEEVLNA